MPGLFRYAFAALVLTATGATPSAALAERVTVFAAASLHTALSEIGAGFEAASGHQLVVSLAGSSSMARQIQHGAPADVFISASGDWMDVLEAGGLLARGTRIDLLQNELVLVAHGSGAEPVDLNPQLDLVRLLGRGRLAMALVDAVPAGIYGRQALQHLGLWQAVERRVVQTDNVRVALALVARGEVPYGIVYRTDAAVEPRVSVVGSFPPGSHAPVVYPAAVLHGRAGPAVAEFFDYLQGPEARAAFERQGFGFLPR